MEYLLEVVDRERLGLIATELVRKSLLVIPLDQISVDVGGLIFHFSSDQSVQVAVAENKENYYFRLPRNQVVVIRKELFSLADKVN